MRSYCTIIDKKQKNKSRDIKILIKRMEYSGMFHP